MSTPPSSRPWYLRIGPGLITACVVIGPGSILTASKTGAKYGYSMSWVVVFAVIFMMVFTAMGARIGAVADRSMGDLLRDKAGKWLAILIGCSVFFISAAFQFGNNLGVHSAFKQYVDFDYTVVIFNLISIAFIFAAKDLYKIVEKLMMAFVSFMLVSFAINLIFAKPDLAGVAKGLIPSGSAINDLTVLALIGTTFVVAAAYYQSYLVRQKGWGKEQLKDGLIDARVGAVIMAVITLTIMTTSASVFYKPPKAENNAVVQGVDGVGSSEKSDAKANADDKAVDAAVVDGKDPVVDPDAPVKLDNVGDVAKQLEPLFGEDNEMGKHLFCLGLLCAAYSSFIVNSMIGGFILSDGLGLGNKPTDLWPKLLTVLVLLTGMGVGLVVIQSGYKPVAAIVMAQAVVVIAAPLIAGTMLWISSRRDVMGDQQSGPLTKIIGTVGVVVLLAISANIAINKVIPGIGKLMDPPAQVDDAKK